MILESLRQNETDEFESAEPMCDRPSLKVWAQETIEAYHTTHAGSTVGERLDHRPWPPEVVLAFLAAPIIRPAKGEIQRKLYGNSRGLRLGG